ncbi:hypothetical protein VTN31DRAFT_6722 [Thermomyces dupontii]|uniref:uncharacterized protein n=1 Tax=Talaromyces thermophilus TaxID=28565 RepID=UPI003743A997
MDRRTFQSWITEARGDLISIQVTSPSIPPYLPIYVRLVNFCLFLYMALYMRSLENCRLSFWDKKAKAKLLAEGVKKI